MDIIMDTSENPNIDLSQETIEKLQEELRKYFTTPPSGNDIEFPLDLDLKDPSDFEDPSVPKKLIQCAHEIIFNITAHVMEENEKGEVTSSVEICTKSFHIPVPFNKDYKSYMKTFFDHLETSILNTIQETNEKAEELEND
jgi:hypothetical protein